MRKKEKDSVGLRCRIILGLITILFITMTTSTGGCFTMFEKKDSISNLSFNHDGKKVVFDRCRNEGCQIQVYDLETGELSAYQSPKNERWTMGKYSYDGWQIAFSVIPIVDGNLDLAEMQIAVMDANGKNYRKVTTGQGAKLYPVFSHAGTKVLYARAAFIRKKGRTPASQYDAWEFDLVNGAQTQLTFFKYHYMGNLTYYPDDEHFICSGDMPTAFPGGDPSQVNSGDNQTMHKQEENKKTILINGVVKMKVGEQLPTESFNFGEKFVAKKPLLSSDGSNLIVEKNISGGKFFLYSPDGNHRLVGSGGSANSAAISPDGALLGIIASPTLHIFRVQDGRRKVILYLPRAPKTVTNFEQAMITSSNLYMMIHELPSRIINK